MALVRSRWFRVAVVVVLLGIPATWLFAHNDAVPDTALVTTVKHGDFSVLVTTSGELRARKSVQITVPQGAMQAQIYQMKIATLVPEGTLVKTGDVVATLDRATLAPKLAEVTLGVQKAQAEYEQAMLDSALTLSKARENIRSLELALEQKKIVKEQSIYEAPSIQQQTDIDYQQAQRAVTQAKADYKTQVLQAKAKMSEQSADLSRQKNQLQMVQSVMAGFTIRAPSPGMVIYQREYNGQKRTAGSQVNSFDGVVATLPDLTKMESVTYVNEIDVRKVAVGQHVAISLDADPGKKLTGVVTNVANVGEQRPNSDAKVFEVHINIEKPDTTLRPGMTTGNSITTFTAKDVNYIPIEAVSTDSGLPVVYVQSGSHVVKQEVETAQMNDDDVIVTRGLKPGDRILMAAPADHDRLAIVHLPGSRNVAPVPNGDTALPVQPAPSKKATPGVKGAPPAPSADSTHHVLSPG